MLTCRPYSYSHTSTVKWALEQELNRLRAMKSNDTDIIDFLKVRITQLKQDEVKWHEVSSKGVHEESIFR